MSRNRPEPALVDDLLVLQLIGGPVRACLQNGSLFCASAGLATLIRAWMDRDALSEAMGLTQDEELQLARTVGLPK